MGQACCQSANGTADGKQVLIRNQFNILGMACNRRNGSDLYNVEHVQRQMMDDQIGTGVFPKRSPYGRMIPVVQKKFDETLAAFADLEPSDLILTEETIAGFRSQQESMIKAQLKKDKTFYEPSVAQCDIGEFSFDTRDDFSITVYIIRPKALKSVRQRPAYVYAHGGGGIT